MHTQTTLRVLSATLLLTTWSANAPAQTAPAYARTEFLHGYGDNSTQWASAAGQLNQSLNLGGTYRVRDLNTAVGINAQKDELLAKPEWQNTTDKVVLVGHSMGGLVARATAVARPNQVFGIVTVASPIRGTRLVLPAQLGQVRARILDALSRIQALTFLFRSVYNEFALIISQVKQYFDSQLGTSLGIADLGQNSPAVQAINTASGPPIPVAQVTASVPPGSIHLRLAASRGFTSLNFGQLTEREGRYLGYARLMKYWAYSRLTGWGIARQLGFAINAYEKIDGTIFTQSTGYTLTWPPAPLPAFDGIVAADDAAWQGWGDVRLTTTAIGDDHVSVQGSPQGIVRQDQALRAIGVFPR
jgi:pimeloyl-ACP methyl ester carboxylesterase